MKGFELDPADVRAFAGRNWALINRRKREHWARTHSTVGRKNSVALVHSLYQHALSLDPHFVEKRREEDLHHHVKLKKLIDAAAYAFTVR